MELISRARRGETSGRCHRGSALGRRAARRGARARALGRGGPGPRARDHAARTACIPGGGRAQPGTPRRRGGDRARRGRARRAARAARAGAGRRPCRRKPVLRRGGARRPPRQRAARARRWRLVAARRRVDLGIPDSVQGVLAARIDLLPAEAKEALQAASVIGRSFTPAGLAALTGSSAEVRTLVERGFVRPTQPELVFKHALTRDVAYGSLPKASRARLHAAFARWLEADDAPAPAPACWRTTTRRRSLPASRTSPGGTARKSSGSSLRRRCTGCGAPPSSRWRASISTTRSCSFTAPPSSRPATPSCGMRSAG